MTDNKVVIVELDHDDGRTSDEFFTQSVYDDVVKNERFVPRRTQSLLDKLNNVTAIITIILVIKTINLECNKKVNKTSKSRMLLRYSITYH